METIGDVAARFCATLVDEWVRAGVTHAMVAPGSRSTPMAIQLSERKEISTHIFHDERSAAFAALGVGLATSRPAVVLCTSGTAATHFHAAVVEADLSAVPMIVVTADRPPELRDVGAPQTITQTQLYGSAVRWFHDPGVPSGDAEHTWRALAARVCTETLHAIPGPVHLNIPFREPLVGRVSSLPAQRDAQWSMARIGRGFDGDGAELAAMLSGRRGVIVAGRGADDSVLDLARALLWPVLADARSGLRTANSSDVVVAHFDGVVRTETFVTRNQPEVVIRVGEPPASKVLGQWLTKCGARTMHIHPYAKVIDPDHAVMMRVVADVSSVVQAVKPHVVATEPTWLRSWVSAERAASSAVSSFAGDRWSEPTIARTLASSAGGGSHVVVSSSMPVRDLEWFGGGTCDARVYSNRGANGIDGVVSTAVGVALATGAITYLLIGDVAMLHDVNGILALSSRNADVRIVVVNNNGGSIFSFLPQASVLNTNDFEMLYGTPHDVHFESLAHAYGVSFDRVTNADALKHALSQQGPRIIEACTDRSVNVSQHDELNAAIISAVTATL
jgi:2-succinyl-5-enolpyruvyl-6-hydroxy-3-cyclohexene-1-carboxylate synthase